MSRLRWVVLAWLVVSATGAWAYTVEVTSSPTGAEVWASPADQPIIYKKGVTPCEVALDEAGAPHVIIVRAPGRFDAFREVAATGSLSVTLAARDDPAAWAQLPTVVELHGLGDDDGPALGVWAASWGATRASARTGASWPRPRTAAFACMLSAGTTWSAGRSR